MNCDNFDDGKPYVKLMFPVYGDKPFIENRTVLIPDPKATTKTLADICEEFAVGIHSIVTQQQNLCIMVS